MTNKRLPDDTELFREAMRDVRRVRAQTSAPRKPRPAPIAKFTRADQQEVLKESLLPTSDPAAIETGDELAFRRQGVPEAVLRKLRRGAYAVEAEIDLHGLTGAETKAVLREFIANSTVRGLRCVRIIHGKGRRSGPRGPVLKNVVNTWLRQSNAVTAFGSARSVDGGSGAAYVLLRSK